MRGSPYQTPAGISALEEYDDEPMRAVALRQRLNRLRMCCYYLTGSVITGLLMMLVVILIQALDPWLAGALMVAAVGFVVLALIWMVTLVVRRLHDLDRSGWWWLLTFVPLLNVFFWLYLLIAPGTPGGNQYGPPNPDNPILVIIFGGLFWLLSLLGFMANLVILVVMLVGGDLSGLFALQGLEGFPG